MIIGVDIDNTIACTTYQGNVYVKEMFPDCNDYHDLKEEDYLRFIKKYAGKIRSEEPLMDGVKEAFRYFEENNFKVIFITARNNSFCNKTMDITKEYLKKHGLKYDKIIFDKDKKGSIAKENNIELFIDDREDNLEDISKYGIECIRITSDLNSKFKTFNNWYQILDYIKGKDV